MRRLLHFIILTIIFTGFSSSLINSMPPHPDLLKKFYKKNKMQLLKERFRAEKIRKMNAVSKLNASPYSGTMKVPVILIQFPAGYAYNKSIINKETNFKYAGLGFFIFIIAGIIFTTIFGRKRNIKGIMLILMIVFLSPVLFYNINCQPLNPFSNSSSSDDDKDDNTDPSYYNSLSFNASDTPTFYSNLFKNTDNLHPYSFQKYYTDMSNNGLTLDFDFYGPYTATHPYKYYGQNLLGYDMYPATLAGEAVDLAEADGCNFAQYDKNGDNKVDTVIVIHAGAGEEASGNPNQIWSHNWTLSNAQSFGDGTGARTYDNKTIDNYTMQPEFIFTPGDSTIGVFCHEFGHALGLMDLYDIDYNTWGAGDWSLMASGSWNGTNGDRPAPLLAWEKNELGWITIKNAVSGVNAVVDVEDSHEAYKIPITYEYPVESGNNPQYFLIENKRYEADNYWNAGLPGQGLLITLIDEYYISSARSSNRINSRYNGITNAHGVTIIEADATSNTITDWHLWKSPYISNNSGSSTDTFYNIGSKTSLTPSTTPNSYRNDYLSASSVTRVDSGVTITNISAQGDSMNFTIP